jgi:hypothetical protein
MNDNELQLLVNMFTLMTTIQNNLDMTIIRLTVLEKKYEQLVKNKRYAKNRLN